MRGFLNFLYFDTLITPDVIRAFFIISNIGIIIGIFNGLFGNINGIGIAIMFFLSFMLNRLLCEYLIIQFKISEDLSKIVKNQESK